ncbi:MAG: peptidoglycan DD-metalloendopeptidase family protein [Anaerolineaceae bacterium]|nr:peptidoglycan DD-metalloendopeptidase family protein [Anaerolineaceae bacterium]
MRQQAIKQVMVGLTTTLLLLVACATPAGSPTPLAAVNTPAATLTSAATATHTAVPTATNTPTPVHTPTPSPTPTATAVPLTVLGDIRSLQLRDPVPTGSAACGLVDLFDFPIDPPHAASVGRGGGDFGVFRDRFDKFHAGEDWGGPGSRPNLGTPVYSIGHGLVTYAQPLGWGRDQGVVIIEHTFANGRTLLSFYGHLDPASVLLTPGTCVQRGQLVGQIGQPRSSPHLHFEVRTQAPYQTLTGYWPEDPTSVGWLWPSQEIWAARVGAIPGVSWARPFARIIDDDEIWLGGSQPVGYADDTSYLLLEGGQLTRLNMADGRSNPILFSLETIDAALQHETSRLLFLADSRTDILAAYRLPDLIQQWQIRLTLNSAVRLLPLPDGGVLATTRTSLTAVSAAGAELWTLPLESQVLDWLLAEDTLYLTTDGNDGRLWQITAANARPIADLGGKLALNSSGLWLYHREGLYRFDLASDDSAPTLIYDLPPGTVSRGDLLVLPDGGLLLAHSDAADRRLLHFGADGRLTWERSFNRQLQGNVTLHLVNDQPYLATSLGSGNNGELVLYALNQAQNSLTRLFEGGSRTPLANEMWVTAVANNQLLINVGGGPLALFDPASGNP